MKKMMIVVAGVAATLAFVASAAPKPKALVVMLDAHLHRASDKGFRSEVLHAERLHGRDVGWLCMGRGGYEQRRVLHGVLIREGSPYLGLDADASRRGGL